MKIAHSLVSILALTLNSIKLIWPFECLPNGEPIPGVPRGVPALSSPPHFPPPTPSGRSELPERSPFPAEHLPPPHPAKNLPARPMSLPAMNDSPFRSIILPSPDGMGCGLNQLRFIRLISKRNLHLGFEFRRYTFPVDKMLKMKTGNALFRPIPNEEQIVLSATNGDVLAILETHNVLAGIYKHIRQKKKRVKINMESNVINELDREELYNVPVGPQRSIMRSFKVQNINRYVNNNPASH